MQIGIDGRIFSKPGSGIVKYSFGLMQALLDCYPQNKYYIYVSKYDNWKSKINFKGKYTIKEISLPKPMWRSKLFTDILDHDRIDVWHSMHLIVPYVPSWMRRVAVVQTCHGINPNEYWSSLKDELYWRPTLSLGAKFSDRIICMSDDCRQVMRKRYGFPLERMDVGYLGLNKSLKRMNKKERENAKRYLQKKYNLPDKNFILYVGGTLKNKNLNTAFNTWFILRSKYNFNLPLIITRIDNKDIPYMTALGNGCTIRPGKDIIGISWIEKEEDLNLFYNCATFTIYPSLFEGLGYPICESMKCGTPVITSNISAMPEAAGGAALLVNNPKNPKEWANAIWNLYNNKRLQKKLVRLGLKRAKRFTWSKIADSAIESYKKAISDKKTKRI